MKATQEDCLLHNIYLFPVANVFRKYIFIMLPKNMKRTKDTLIYMYICFNPVDVVTLTKNKNKYFNGSFLRVTTKILYFFVYGCFS
jgi:hypothetical protein